MVVFRHDASLVVCNASICIGPAYRITLVETTVIGSIRLNAWIHFVVELLRKEECREAQSQRDYCNTFRKFHCSATI